MSYRSIRQMANSASLHARIAACAAREGCPEHPVTWTQNNIWKIVASPGWDTDWDYAIDTATVNMNPDTGDRDDVISDSKILAVVQPMIAALLNP